jgi:AraC-like DNA-binding protein
MNEVVLFNFNDITVLFSGFLSLVLALLLWFRSPGLRIKRSYWACLALFFFLCTLHTVDTLLYWNPSVKSLALSTPNVFFSLGFTAFLQGPLLYWFTKAAIYRDFKFRHVDSLHLIPFVIFPVYLYAIYWQFEADYKFAYVNDWALVKASIDFELLIWAQRLVAFGYGSVCAFQLYKYISHLKNTSTTLSKVDLHWLKLLVFGFAAISTLGLLTLLQSRLISSGLDGLLGKVENHVFFIYSCVLIFYLLQNSNGFAEIKVEHTIGAAPKVQEPQLYVVEKLHDLMITQRPYLEPHITVERLAHKLDVSPKILSSAINSLLQVNFFELMSHYRLEEAKRRLIDPEHHKVPIGDVMKNCGFSSKSVFNEAFKKSVGVTPSHYRQQYLG